MFSSDLVLKLIYFFLSCNVILNSDFSAIRIVINSNQISFNVTIEVLTATKFAGSARPILTSVSGSCRLKSAVKATISRMIPMFFLALAG